MARSTCARRCRGAAPVVTQTREHHRPCAVVDVIAPWNYPLNLGLGDTIPALLAGNRVALSPDAQTPFTPLWAVRLLYEAGLPRELVRVVAGPGPACGRKHLVAVGMYL